MFCGPIRGSPLIFFCRLFLWCPSFLVGGGLHSVKGQSNVLCKELQYQL